MNRREKSTVAFRARRARRDAIDGVTSNLPKLSDEQERAVRDLVDLQNRQARNREKARDGKVKKIVRVDGRVVETLMETDPATRLAWRIARLTSVLFSDNERFAPDLVENKITLLLHQMDRIDGRWDLDAGEEMRHEQDMKTR